MRATKENCRKAILILEDMEVDQGAEDFNRLKEFLTACLTRLPTEAAMERDRNRRVKNPEQSK